MSDVIKGVNLLEPEDLYPQFGQEKSTRATSTSKEGVESAANAGKDTIAKGVDSSQAAKLENLTENDLAKLSPEELATLEQVAQALEGETQESDIPERDAQESDSQDSKVASAESANTQVSKTPESKTPESKTQVSKRPFELSSEIKPRSFASLQMRAKSAMRALFAHENEHLLVLCVSSSVDAISTTEDLVREVSGLDPTIAYAPTKFELFGSDQEPGIVTRSGEEDAEAVVVVMPCSHLNDHPKWLGMLDACLAQNTMLKLVLCGDATDIATLSMMWPTLDNGLHADVVLEFSASNALEIIAGLISYYQKSNPALLPFDFGAVVLLACYCCRLSGDRRYIGLTELKLKSLIFEASQRALDGSKRIPQAQEGSGEGLCVTRNHVLWALCADDFRNNYLAESVLRDHRDRQLLIATSGAVIGQINGLSVVETIGTSYEYGEPVRITATARAGGEGDVIDIERKAELAGQIHAKAMMIINGFLTKEFGSEQPLPVSASLVFEQSYSEVDGDSASLTGLCAVISALAQVPIRQDLAVTGAVDQFGDVQAVGGVNEKIEGFFRVCKLHGLNGTQGVIIPSSCVNQLVLRPAVVKAVEQGKFHIFTVSHVTEAVKLLTTLDWGDVETEGTVCERIATRLSSIIAGSHEMTWYEELIDWVRSKLSRQKSQSKEES